MHLSSFPLLVTSSSFIPSIGLVAKASSLWLTYRFALALYNVSPLHPLHRISEPLLAAASFRYEFWFDCVLFGKYAFEIKRMHQVYGKKNWPSRSFERGAKKAAQVLSYESTRRNCTVTTPLSPTRSMLDLAVLETRSSIFLI